MMSDRLRQLTSETGKSASRVAMEIGIRDATFSDWQCGKVSPRAVSVIQLCKYFNVSADYLLGLSTVREIDATTEELTTENGKLTAEVERLRNAMHEIGRIANDDV